MSQTSLRRLPAILIVSGELCARESIGRALEEHFELFCAANADDGLRVLEREQAASAIHIALHDLRESGDNGLGFLRELRQRWPDVMRLAVASPGDCTEVVKSLAEAGIWQCLAAPCPPELLRLTLLRAAEVWRLRQENQRLALDLRGAEPALRRRTDARPEKPRQPSALDSLIHAPGSPLETVSALIRRVAPFDLSVMITGESGAGKEMVARAIHGESRRADRPFITENCGALPDSLLESELFGYKRGAFTGAVEDRVGLFQQADGGTLFLDEIGETSPAFQVKLLRALQEGEFRPLGGNRPVTVDVRVIAATNHDLEEDVRTGRFREDLYYRLTTIALHVPPLRARPMDIPLLAGHLLESSARTLGKSVDGFSPVTLAGLASHRWPGNVRELQNEILRMVAMSDAPLLGPELLSPRIVGSNRAAPGDALPATANLHGNLRERLEQLEQRIIVEAMQRHRGNKSRAARELGLSRVGLRAKLARYGLDEADKEIPAR